MYQLKKIYKKYQPLVIPIAMIGISLIILFYGIWPAIQNVQQGLAENKLLLSQTEAMEKRISVLSGLDENALETDMRDVLSAVPPEKDVTSIIYTLESASNKSEVALTELTILTPGSLATDAASQNKRMEENKLGSNILSVSVGVQGQRENMRSFLQLLTTIRRLFRATQVQIDFLPTGSTRAQFAVDAFYLPYPKTLGSASEPLSPLTAAEKTTIDTIRTFTLFPVLTATQVQQPAVEGKQDPFKSF